MKKLFIPLVSVGLAVGCGDVPTGTDGLTPNFGVAGNSGCYTVTGRIVQVAVGPGVLSGTISGDIEGDVATQLDLASLKLSGLVQFLDVAQQWEVTGGNVGELIGRTVRLELDATTVLLQPTLFRNNVKARVIDGAESGNLTYHGAIDVSTAPAVTVDVEYHGVICP